MRFKLFMFLALVFSMPLILNAQYDEYKRYQIKSAIVEYKLSGTQTGTATLYFDDYGRKEASYEKTEMEMFGMKQVTDEVNYLDGIWIYNVDLKTHTGNKSKNPILEGVIDENSDADFEKVGKEIMVAMGGEKIGNEELLGKDCEIWVIKDMGTKIWVWNSITLKSETNMMGIIMKREATSLKPNASIPADKLKVPADIEFTEIDLNNLQNMMDSYNGE